MIGPARRSSPSSFFGSARNGASWGEEDGLQGGDSTVTWFIDPIDGTSNFARGLAFFCISAGVEVDGTIVAGAVYNPFSEELFTADDAGAYLNGKLLRTPTAQPQDSATLLTG